MEKSNEGFDFREQAKALLKRLAPGTNPALALAAVEAALREAYSRGQGERKRPAPAHAPARPTAPRPAASGSAAVPASAETECDHEWEEAFLDGRTLGHKCVECGVLERDVQARCDHYFVQTGAGEVCVACRKPRKRGG